MTVVATVWDRLHLPPLSELEGPTTIDVATTVLFLIAAAGAWWVGQTYAPTPSTSPSFEAVRADTGRPFKLFGILLAEVVVVVGIYRLYGRAPSWLQRLVRVGLLGLLLASFHWALYQFVGLLPTVGFGLFVATTGLLARYDLSWPIHNGLALALATTFAGLFGILLGPLPLAIFFVLLFAYDYLAVSRTGVMYDLVAVARGWAPVYIVFPQGWRCDTGAVGRDSDDVPDGREPAGILGTGDIVLPAALVTSLALDGVAVVGNVSLAGAGAVIGTVVGLVVARAVGRAEERGVPAIPYIATGALPLVALAWIAVDVLPEVFS